VNKYGDYRKANNRVGETYINLLIMATINFTSLNNLTNNLKMGNPTGSGTQLYLYENGGTNRIPIPNPTQYIKVYVQPNGSGWEVVGNTLSQLPTNHIQFTEFKFDFSTNPDIIPWLTAKQVTIDWTATPGGNISQVSLIQLIIGTDDERLTKVGRGTGSWIVQSYGSSQPFIIITADNQNTGFIKVWYYH